MSFDNIIKPLEKMDEYKFLMSSVESGVKSLEVHGISETQKALIAAALCRKFNKPCLVITHNDILARKIHEDAAFFVGEQSMLLPSGEMIFHKVDARSNEIRQKRLEVLDKALEGGSIVVSASIEALLPKLVSPERFRKLSLTLKVGETVDIEKLKEQLTYMGYEREEMVEGKGQFSIRGGIIDFFPPSGENPVRIELFDDEVDSIRHFDVITQRSINKLFYVNITPVRELLPTEEEYRAAAKKLQSELDKRIKAIETSKKEGDSAKLKDLIGYDIEKIKSAAYFNGIEKYAGFLMQNPASFLEYLGDCIVIVDEPNRVRQRYENIDLEFQEQFKHLLEESAILPSQHNMQFTYDELIIGMKNLQVVTFNTLLKGSSDFKPERAISFVSRSMHPFHGKINLLLEEIDIWRQKNYSVVILSGTSPRGQRLLGELRDKGINAIFKEELDFALALGQIVVLPGTLNGGFEFPTVKYALISDREVFGTQKKKAEKKKSRTIKIFSDLKVGDYVVHENHGIGQYVGIEKLKIDGITRDYLHIKYLGNDKLYIPTDQMDLIQKYIGAEDKPVKLNRLSSAEWAKTKAKAKKSIENMAEDLLKLYAERQSVKGFAFSKDTKWQKEFEDMFPYQETPDQLKCIEEIKEDMESDKPMDRLLCGDVGYGKTEVALRAAFKAVMDGKQVAVLVPTTILAQQHYNTCIQRFANFPVNVDMLSRFRSSGEQKRILKLLKEGNIDVIIGTHRLLQEDVVFKDLGLLIIDEEQRFGVAHKERIKQIKKNIDVLTLTATPIPRTLHMSLIGARDISVIEEPPEERYPVQTYVMEYNEEIIKDAIIKEINRGGQVYFLYNKVRSINRVAAKLKELVPDARFAVAHGQMEEKELEETMLSFYNQEYDVLVCTTIIETGLDIPNVNTIIIYDADRMGLSQLYQLRGRVGRSNRLAYAYLTYQKDKVLTEVAEKRLQAIKEFTEFGSGFKVAMRDLEIRGMGNILGTEQHGHMEAIGYDLYTKLLEETVRELKGLPIVEDIDTSIELQINAYIPETYISDEGQKIEIYKKIAAIESKDELFDVEEEVEDRFGDIPECVRNLMTIAYVKSMAKICGITSVSQKNSNVVIKFKSDKYIKAQTAVFIVGEYKNTILFNASEQPYFSVKVHNLKPDEVLSRVKEIIEKISSFHNA